MPKKIPRLAGVMFIGLGILAVLFSMGAIAYTPTRNNASILNDPRHWTVSCLGLAFLGAGIAMLFQERKSWFLVLNGLMVIGTFFPSMIWIVYLSGKAEQRFQLLALLPLLIGFAGAVGGWLKEVVHLLNNDSLPNR